MSFFNSAVICDRRNQTDTTDLPRYCQNNGVCSLEGCSCTGGYYGTICQHSGKLNRVAGSIQRLNQTDSHKMSLALWTGEWGTICNELHNCLWVSKTFTETICQHSSKLNKVTGSIPIQSRYFQRKFHIERLQPFWRINIELHTAEHAQFPLVNIKVNILISKLSQVTGSIPLEFVI